MKKVLFPIFLMMLLSFIDTKACQCISKQTDNKTDSSETQLIVAGEAKMKMHEYRKAINFFKRALEINHGSWKALRLIADCEVELGEFENAIQNYDQVIALRSNDTIAYKNRAEAKRFWRHWGEALSDYEIVLKWTPADTILYFGRGSCFLELGKFEDAIRDFNTLILKSSKEPTFYKLRGASFFNLNQFDKAVNDFNRFFRLGGNDYKALAYRAISYGSLIGISKLYADSVISDVTKYLELSPAEKHTEAFRVLGSSYGAKNDSTRAREYFQKSLNSNPDNMMTLYNWGELELNLKNYAVALKMFEKVETKISLEDKDKDFFYRIGVAKAGTKDTTGAANAYADALKVDGSFQEVYAARVKLYYGNNKYNSTTLQDLDQLIHFTTDKKRLSLLYSSKSLVENRMQKASESKSDLAKAVEADSENSVSYLVKGTMTDWNKNSKGALAAFDKAIQLNPKFGEAYMMKAYVYYSKHDSKKACSELNQAVKAGFKIRQSLKDKICSGKTLNKGEDYLSQIVYPYIKEAIVNP